jgi:hypothetical protein
MFTAYYQNYKAQIKEEWTYFQAAVVQDPHHVWCYIPSYSLEMDWLVLPNQAAEVRDQCHEQD